MRGASGPPHALIPVTPVAALDPPDKRALHGDFERPHVPAGVRRHAWGGRARPVPRWPAGALNVGSPYHEKRIMDAAYSRLPASGFRAPLGASRDLESRKHFVSVGDYIVPAQLWEADRLDRVALRALPSRASQGASRTVGSDGSFDLGRDASVDHREATAELVSRGPQWMRPNAVARDLTAGANGAGRLMCPGDGVRLACACVGDTCRGSVPAVPRARACAREKGGRRSRGGLPQPRTQRPRLRRCVSQPGSTHPSSPAGRRRARARSRYVR